MARQTAAERKLDKLIDDTRKKRKNQRTGSPLLTHKQEKFVMVYAGSSIKAAELAGYKNPKLAGRELMLKPIIQLEIARRAREQLDPYIATKEERQRWWTSVMLDPNYSIKDRCRASELLGKSQGDFFDRVEQKQDITIRWLREEEKGETPMVIEAEKVERLPPGEFHEEEKDLIEEEKVDE